MNYTILCKPRRDARVVEWAGLEIRSLSQDRGFESLSLLETKSEAERLRFFFKGKCEFGNPRRGFD